VSGEHPGGGVSPPFWEGCALEKEKRVKKKNNPLQKGCPESYQNFCKKKGTFPWKEIKQKERKIRQFLDPGPSRAFGKHTA